MAEFSVEYLAIFRRTDSFCTSSDAFIRLLQVDSAIAVKGARIIFKKADVCGFQISHGEVAGKNQRYFQLKFTWSGDPDAPSELLEQFMDLLKVIRKVSPTILGPSEAS
jgi:hypothetical protein